LLGVMLLVAVVALGVSYVRISEALRHETQAKSDLGRALEREHQTSEELARTAYSQRIALAEREWAGNNLGRLEQLLGDCPEDLRAWEGRYLRRLRSGALPPLRHESSVSGVAFSPPDGQYLATATQAGVLRLWQAKTGQELRKWLAHETCAASVVFSPD